MATLNFCLYPLVFSYFYLLLPSFLHEDILARLVFKVSPAASQAVDWLGTWAVIVFLGTYMASTDNTKIRLSEIEISKTTRLFAKTIQWAVALLMFFVLILHGSSLSNASDRGASYAIYEPLLNKYKLGSAFALAIVTSIIGYLSSKKLISFALLIPFCLLDILAGGRGYLFSSLLLIYIASAAVGSIHFGRLTVAFGLLAVTVFLTAFFRRMEEGLDSIIMLFGEFYANRLTAQFTFDNLYAVGDFGQYTLSVLSRFAPQFLIGPLFEAGPTYAVVLNNHTGLTYGLAGSIVSEALYYGGMPFAVAYPMLMASVYFLMQRSRITLTLPGFIFFLLLATSTFNIFRSSFFMTWATLVYMTIFYVCPIIFKDLRKRVFMRNPRAVALESQSG